MRKKFLIEETTPAATSIIFSDTIVAMEKLRLINTIGNLKLYEIIVFHI